MVRTAPITMFYRKASVTARSSLPVICGVLHARPVPASTPLGLSVQDELLAPAYLLVGAPYTLSHVLVARHTHLPALQRPLQRPGH